LVRELGKSKVMKILITGGHLTPALSCMDWIAQNQPSDKLIFVGREFSQDLLKQEAVEKYEVEKRKIPFIAFSAVRLGRDFYTHFFRELSRFFQSIKTAKKIILQQKPTVILSFGGYVAVPFAIAGFLTKTPIVTHEQTLTTGFANQLIGFFAKKIAVSFEQSKNEFPNTKTIVTGNPLRAGVFLSRHQKPNWLPKEITKPILLVLGGNQGSQVLNELIINSLTEITKDWLVVHQCGRPTTVRDYFKALSTAKSHLPHEQQDNYFVHEWMDEEDLFWLYRNAIGAISRSGANATQEIAVAGLPAIFVPIPNSHKDEQYKNARWLVDIGAAILIEQAGLSQEVLMLALDKIQLMQKPMREALSKLKFEKDAAAKLYELIKAAI